MDEDLFDEIADDEAPGLGILVRTDFSNEGAWRSFLEKLREGEGEFSPSAGREEDTGMDQDEPSTSTSASAPASSSDVKVDVDKADSDGSSDQDSGPIISILDPSPEIRPYFSDISNLTALRLLNDVDLRKLAIPPDAKRFNPPNPIVDYDGWQEIYHGKTLWIYDAMSNQDQCARLVSKRSDFYGTATGDSWRARVSHICELQVNISTGAITIDFGGMDKYTYEERVRNLQDAMDR
ncbi:hypothetical protein BDM02DRAFT_3107105 [Thelephora ganbajun]|uniref:Uncharacterized protein n=1 Tax=Thelephora ganbajun TaxID=370292 RepID=A0ACB6ZWL4_THEGA|nr:hypothetical protein BDM02DRAFT_3107105 [Thelephora ganbajun]